MTVKRTAKSPSKPAAAPKPARKVAKVAVKVAAKTKAKAKVAVRAKPRIKAKVKPRVRSPFARAKFTVGDVVRHKIYPFRGVIFDIDPVFANSDDWWLSIPEKMRPRKDQPFYHLLAENAETEYIAYVSEQNLLRDTSGVPVRHPQVTEYFEEDDEGRYRPVFLNQLN